MNALAVVIEAEPWPTPVETAMYIVAALAMLALVIVALVKR